MSLTQSFQHLVKALFDKERPIIDLSPGVPDEETEIRVVRDSDHIGKAYGGDRVRIAKSELAQKPIANALLTEAEYAEVIENRAKAMLNKFVPQASAVQRTVDAGFERAIEARRKAEEDARLERVRDDRQRDDLESARMDKLATQLIGRIKTG